MRNEFENKLTRDTNRIFREDLVVSLVAWAVSMILVVGPVVAFILLTY